MENSNTIEVCIHCGKNDNEAPILLFKFKGEQMPICSGCMPVLIHHPEQLTGKLIKVDSIDLGSIA